MISHLRLKTTKNLSPSINLQVDDNGFEFVVINHKNFDATFSLHGAHLIHFQIKQQAPLIYLSKSTPYNHSKAIEVVFLFVGHGLVILKKVKVKIYLLMDLLELVNGYYTLLMNMKRELILSLH